MGGTEDPPATYLPFEHHPEEDLPEEIRNAYPAGNPAAESRTPEQQAALEARKHEIMRKMTLQEMQERYKKIAEEIVERIEELDKQLAEWNQEKEKLDTQQELEEAVLKRMLNAGLDD